MIKGQSEPRQVRPAPDRDAGLAGRSRRDVLKTLAVVGAAASLFPLRFAMAQSSSGPAPRIIDIHHHMFPPRYKVLRRQAIIDSTMMPKTPFGWTLRRSLDEMNKNGVATAMLSLSPPGVWFNDVKQSRQLVKIVNDFGAHAVKDHPGRFGLFAAVGLPDTAGSLKEIEYAFDTLKADGVGVFTSYTVGKETKWLGDPAFAPAFDELNRRKAVVFVHPDVPICCLDLGYAPPPLIELPFDTTRTIVSLLLSGTLARCPDIKFIFSHGGGTVPMTAIRINAYVNAHPEIAAKLPQGAMSYLNKLNYDLAQTTSAAAIAAVLEQIPADQVLFGTDYPYGSIAKEIAGLRSSAEKLHGLGGADFVQAVERTNALRIAPRLAQA